MKIGVELEFFICHKSDETFYMPDIISRYLKYNSGFISMQKDSNGICIKAKNELGVTISFEFTYSIIEFSIDPQYDILSLHSIINTAIYDFSLFIDHYELMLISHGIAPFNIQFKYVNNPYYKLIREFHGNDNIAKICSSQSHIDYKDEDLIKIINTYNASNWINALLFSNSPHIVNSNKTILCYRDYIWKFSSHGRDSNNILISKEFNDIEDLNAFNNSKLIFMVYRESKPILLSQIPFNQYVTLKQVKGLQFDEDCISETWIHPSVDDYKYLRSYQNVAITNRRTIEIRSDCQQPFNRLIYPAVFNFGLKQAVNEVSSYLNNINFNFFQLRDDVVQNGFDTKIVESKKWLTGISINILYIIKEKYRSRGFGEEKYVDVLINQMIEEINPAIEYLSIKNKKEYFMAEWRDFLKSK